MFLNFVIVVAGQRRKVLTNKRFRRRLLGVERLSDPLRRLAERWRTC